MPKRSQERVNFLCGVMCSAVEGGINYWAETRHYEWGSENGRFKLGAIDKPTFEYSSVEVRDFEDTEGQWHQVTIDTIAKGIRLLTSKQVGVADRILGYIASDDIDSDAADCIVQAALFGKIVYG